MPVQCTLNARCNLLHAYRCKLHYCTCQVQATLHACARDTTVLNNAVAHFNHVGLHYETLKFTLGRIQNHHLCTIWLINLLQSFQQAVVSVQLGFISSCAIGFNCCCQARMHSNTSFTNIHTNRLVSIYSTV